MEDTTIWWLLTGGVVVAELVTGTFCLLMLAAGLAAAAVSAHLGASWPTQIAAVAIVGTASVLALHRIKRRRSGDVSAQAERSVNLDIGETLMIEQWNADGTAMVKYRGAQWTAIHRPGITPQTGLHRVSELVGNRLLVDSI